MDHGRQPVPASLLRRVTFQASAVGSLLAVLVISGAAHQAGVAPMVVLMAYGEPEAALLMAAVVVAWVFARFRHRQWGRAVFVPYLLLIGGCAWYCTTRSDEGNSGFAWISAIPAFACGALAVACAGWRTAVRGPGK